MIKELFICVSCGVNVFWYIYIYTIIIQARYTCYLSRDMLQAYYEQVNCA